MEEVGKVMEEGDEARDLQQRRGEGFKSGEGQMRRLGRQMGKKPLPVTNLDPKF